MRRNKTSFEVDQIRISITKKYRKVTSWMDIFYTNLIRYFALISVHIGFGIIQVIGDGKVSTLADSLKALVNLVAVPMVARGIDKWGCCE